MNLESLFMELNRLKARLEELERKQPEMGRWLDWTPTVTQGVSVTFTTAFARYIVSQNTVIIRARLTATSAGTGGSAITIGGLPFSIANTGVEAAIGSGVVNDISTSLYGGVAIGAGASAIRILYPVSGGNYIGVNPNMALASGDVVAIFGAYERT